MLLLHFKVDLRTKSGQGRSVSQKLFGTDGVRGLANSEPITAQSAMRLVQAAIRVLGSTQNRPTVLVGRDTRASGEMLEAAVVAGLTGYGANVLLAGVLPTPAIAYLTMIHRAALGVVISASHNPFQDNGIKFFGSDGYKINDQLEAAIEACYFESRGAVAQVTGKQIGRVRVMRDAVEQYAAFASSTFPKELSLTDLEIVIDVAHGSAFQTTPLVLSSLGAQIDVRCAAPDGYNINANCGSTEPELIRSLVRETRADVGVAHDGDADRVLFCDETGEPLDGDELLALAAIDLLNRGKLRENTVVATVMSNFGLDHLIRSRNGTVLRTLVGDKHVVDAMVDENLNLGGEQSGHIVFRDFTTTGDGLITALQILAIMVSTGKPLSELRKVLRKFPQVQRNIMVREKLPFEQFPDLMRLIREAEAKLAGNGRVLLRYSGTEPKARLLLEGPIPAQIEELAETITAELARQLTM